MRLLPLVLVLALPSLCLSQDNSWKAKLGYTDDDVLLILHGDDLGVNHAVNAASIDGLERGVLNSTSIMVPTPWFDEIAAYFIAHPDHDYGLHLTLTAEWNYYKWDGLTGQATTPGLHDASGHLYPSVAEVVAHATAAEVEAELRAQIDRALAAGLRPSHLDSHMGALYYHEDFFDVLVRLGAEYRIPVFLPIGRLQQAPYDLGGPHPVLVDAVYMNTELTDRAAVFAYYDETLRNLQPGLNELIVHLGKDNDELRAAYVDHPYYGSAWRQHDWEYLTSPHLRELLREQGITLITWREIQGAVYGD